VIFNNITNNYYQGAPSFMRSPQQLEEQPSNLGADYSTLHPLHHYQKLSQIHHEEKTTFIFENTPEASSKVGAHALHH